MNIEIDLNRNCCQLMGEIPWSCVQTKWSRRWFERRVLPSWPFQATFWRRSSRERPLKWQTNVQTFPPVTRISLVFNKFSSYLLFAILSYLTAILFYWSLIWLVTLIYWTTTFNQVDLIWFYQSNWEKRWVFYGSNWPITLIYWNNHFTNSILIIAIIWNRDYGLE